MADRRRRRTGRCAHRAHEEEDQDTMTVDLSVEVPAAPVQRFDVLAELDQLQARVRSAEERAANLERGLATNRRIGIAVGILMCRRQLTADQAIAILTTHSQHRNVKVRELAETVIYTGTL
jgi:AmiR/NasT family two-component response regulator